MNKNNQSTVIADRKGYVSPVCNVFFVGPQRIICDSETEKVGEDEGEW